MLSNKRLHWISWTCSCQFSISALSALSQPHNAPATGQACYQTANTTKILQRQTTCVQLHMEGSVTQHEAGRVPTPPNTPMLPTIQSGSQRFSCPVTVNLEASQRSSIATHFDATAIGCGPTMGMMTTTNQPFTELHSTSRV